MAKKTKYQLTLDYLFQQLPMFQRIGPPAFKKDLTNTLAFCNYLGNPHEKFQSIHIAGTNGKGSVAHMLAAILSSCGLKTGLYTSPHYKDFRERIKINGQFILKREVVSFVDQHKGFCEELKPSFFEWTVGLAFHHFAKEGVDVAVVETGMGGLTDSTNVLTPVLSIITNIGYDHQQFLGSTLPEIAIQKAGIIKPGIPVVIGETQDETKAVFLSKARECNSPIFFADQEYSAKLTEKQAQHSCYNVRNLLTNEITDISLNHTGDYQSKNLPTVFKACEVIPPTVGMSKKKLFKNIPTGLAQLKSLSTFIGRWEIISTHPTILVDSAHNEAGIRLAIQGLRSIDFDKLHFVLGVVNDKTLDSILSQLPTDAAYYFAKANIPRGLDARTLKAQAANFNLNGKAYSSVRTALSAARIKANPKDLIFVGGSIFVVAEVI